jgi:hypothetical protein
MPLTYQRAQEMWARKAKHKDFKAVERDMRMRKEPDGTFVVHIKGYSYTDGKFERIEHPMAVLTPDNVLTLTLEDRPDQTEAARLRAMLGLSVYLDARGYSQYESSVRIFLERGKSIPFHTGLQFKMSENGHAVFEPPTRSQSTDQTRGSQPSESKYRSTSQAHHRHGTYGRIR